MKRLSFQVKRQVEEGQIAESRYLNRFKMMPIRLFQCPILRLVLSGCPNQGTDEPAD
jgi:hypothetical protein